VNGSDGPTAAQGQAALLEEGLPASPAAPLAVAVPNVSEGRDPAAIAAMADACRAAGARVVDVHSDRDHDRSVLAVVGEPLALQDALVALADECLERIDLRRHQGAHPRIGALDVAPIVALEDEDVPLACEIATGLAGRLGAELNLPVFLYGEVATDPARTLPRDFRRGGLEELGRAIDEGELAPDHGPHRLHPTAGAVLVGVRPPLIALNVWLPDGTLTDARAIAARVRESGGGPPGVRALGLYLPEAGMAQVSMNIEDHRAAPPAAAIAAVRAAAEALGVESGDAELVGLTPRAALLGPSPSALRIHGLRPGHILELRVPGLRRSAARG
jgi:glutamate formiminotransferase